MISDLERETDTEVLESAIHRATELADAAMSYIRAITHAYTIDPGIQTEAAQTEAALISIDGAIQEFHAAALDARRVLVSSGRNPIGQ